MKSIPELKDFLVIGFTRGGLRSHIYTTSACVLLALIALGDYPHLNPIIPACFMLTFVWAVFMIDLGQKVLGREQHTAIMDSARSALPLVLQEVVFPAEQDEVA